MNCLFSLLFFVAANLQCIVAAGIKAGDAWHLDQSVLLANEPLDSIVNPNGVASHMHKIFGGSSMAAAFSFEAARASQCSSVINQADMSNYWQPNLYWIDKTVNPPVFVPLRGDFRFYLFLSQNNDNDTLTAFPDGIRILSGNPSNKSPQPYASFVCQIGNDQSQYLQGDNFNFNRDCPKGMKTNLLFQQCWNGKDLWLPNSAHVVRPTGGSTKSGACPWSHPVKLPTLLLEYTWRTFEYNPGAPLAGNLAWANGDTTGYGIHGDFVNGWDRNVLEKAFNDSTCVGQGEAIAMDDCQTMFQKYDNNRMRNCKPERGQLNETFGNDDLRPIASLPRCNPLWGATGSKPTCNPNPPGLDVTPFKGTDGSYVAVASQRRDLTLPTTAGWKEIGCVSGNANSFIDAVSFIDGQLTQNRCKDACLNTGYNYAAMGNHRDTCMCAKGVNPDAPVATSLCTAPCPGNSSQTCGNEYVFNVFYAGPGTTANTAGRVSLGCYANPTNAASGLLGAGFYNFVSDAMTTQVCTQACVDRNATWALTNAGTKCYCGKTDVTSSLGSGTFVPDSMCTTKCKGNTTEFCGDTYRSNVYNLTIAAVKPTEVNKPKGWQGCFADPAGNDALTGTHWVNGTQTLQSCIDGCAELNYSLAGVENGVDCWCGENFLGGQREPVALCSKPCPGGGNATCGAYQKMELFSTAEGASYTAAEYAASKAAGWQGCYADDGGNTILKAYSFISSSMDADTCFTACDQFGYKLAGLAKGNQCKCDNVQVNTTRLPSGYCDRKCSGNASGTCGGGTTAEVFRLSNNGNGNGTGNVPPNTVTGSKVGCYTDNPRGLPAYPWSSPNMTIEMCTLGCKDMGYSMGGVEYGSQCFCDNSWKGVSQRLPSSSCNQACAGNASQTCGAGSTIDVYNISSVVLPTKPAGWQGCYASKPVSSYFYSSSIMSSSICRTACANLRYKLAATQSGNQCYCGNTTATNVPKVPRGFCVQSCAGTTTGETCGASYNAELYSTAGITSNSTGGYAGCYSDADTAVTGVAYSSTFQTPQLCAQSCFARNYAVAAVVQGNRCKCGAKMPSNLVAESICNAPCTGNSSLVCGSSAGGSVFKTAEGGHSLTIAISANASGYAGCYSEGNTRTLPFRSYASNTNTPLVCASSCKSRGYALSGTENGNECWCAQTLNASSGAYRVADSECNKACPGGAGTCGGASRLSVWLTTAGTSGSTPVRLANETWDGALGCYETGSFFTAAYYSNQNSYISATLCRRTCRNKGFTVAAATDGNKCACGSSLDNLGVTQPDVFCNKPCTGNTTEQCGGVSYASAYLATGPGSEPPAGYPADYIGCFQDTTSRELNASMEFTSGNNAAYCKRVCSRINSTVYGTEAGTQCSCGTGTYLPKTQLPESYCSKDCPAGGPEKCGGSMILSVYDINLADRLFGTGTNSTGGSPGPDPSSTTSPASVSATGSAVEPSSTAVINSTVVSTTSSSTETASETPSGTVPVTPTPSSTDGNNSDPGGENSGSSTPVFSGTQAPSSTPSSSANATASTSSTGFEEEDPTPTATATVTPSMTGTTSTPSSEPSAPPSTTDSTLYGCFTDASNVMTEVLAGCTKATPDYCKLLCRYNGYNVAGLSNGDTCSCTSSTGSVSSVLQTVSAAQCDASCTGDAGVVCGGTQGQMSVYDASSITLPPWERRRRRRTAF